MAEKVQILKKSYLIDAINVYREALSESDRKKWDEFSKFITFYRIKNSDNENLSKYYQSVVRSSNNVKISLFGIPSSQSVKDLLKTMREEFSRRLGGIDINDPQQVSDAYKTLDTEQRSQVDEIHKKIKRMEFLDSIAQGGTAAICPVLTETGESKYVSYATFITEDLVEKMKSTHGNSGNFHMAMGQVLEHEILGHLYNGDLKSDGKRKSYRPYMDEWNHDEKNIYQDLRINVRMHKYGKSRSLQETIPGIVAGNTVKKWFGDVVAIVDSFWKLAHGHISEPDLLKTLVSNWKKFTDTDPDILKINATFNEIDVQKTVDELKKIKSLDDIVKRFQEGEYNSILMTPDNNESKQFKDKLKGREKFSHEEWLDAVKESAELFEQGHLNDLLYNFLGDTYNEYRRLIQWKEEGDGHGPPRRPPHPPRRPRRPKRPSKDYDNIDNDFELPEDEDALVEMDKDEYNALDRQSRDQISKDIDNHMRSYSRTGNYAIREALANIEDPYIRMAIEQSIRQFGELFFQSVDTLKEIRKVVPTVYTDIIEKEIERAEGGAFAFPVGQRLPKTVHVPLNGIILVGIDESGSVSDDEVGRIKTALTDVCQAWNIAVIGVSASANVMKGSASFFQPGKTDPKKFNIRMRDGGTGYFHRVLFDFDKIMNNPENTIYKSLMKELREHNLDRAITPDYLKALHDNGKIGMIVITDGDVPEDVATEKMFEYARKFKERNPNPVNGKHTPVTYISITNHMRDPLDKGKDIIYDVCTR